MASRFSIGIDLGTTNSVLAFVRLDDDKAKIELLPIPQLASADSIDNRLALPSFLFIAPETEGASAYPLPWSADQRFAVGVFAQRQSADVPTRTVVGAKSWLAYSKVDRHQAILPWNAPADVTKVSPVEASRRYLQHLAAAWNNAFADSPLNEQEVVLTVPASFDASARELTRQAALEAGLPETTILLEEPQAALYAWLANQGNAWRKHLKLGDTLLVCDVGGGTTDFTLIGVNGEAGELSLQRIAVGNHTLVGGDNMDLALAHFASAAFAEKGVSLDPWQSVSLWHACRAAKESLLGADAPKRHPVAVLGRGKKLVGGTVNVDLERDAVQRLLLDGFFPECPADAVPERRRASGFRELGLPFEADAAITRHLAAFLSANVDSAGQPIRPTHLLLNGGVFKSAVLRERLRHVLASWGGESTALEGNTDLDFAVARGAAYYGLAKLGRGVRIRGGAARSYYVGIETAGLAIPGAPRPLRALCVVPFGMEEGTAVDVPSEPIGLVVGEPTTFRFFSSVTRKDDQPGTLVAKWNDGEIEETDSLEAGLPASPDLDAQYVPVHFHAAISELGVFELSCASDVDESRWKLEFSVREDADKPAKS